ncbi:MAG TPA: hypothetical protein DCZ95_04565 [Verrucomicrobia bacterium]|nr:MAG: hypothetical protein A2X46_17690 [Lentisphaerae bacterium GWF2_57_35]HBA83350.1 hypothetical protein [Verrucomicrobiota bacterium]
MKQIYNVLVHADASLPSFEVLLLLIILTLCLLFKTSRIGLVSAYLFAYRWGWLVFESSFGNNQSYIYGYTVFGFIALILMVISMVRNIGN